MFHKKHEGHEPVIDRLREAVEGDKRRRWTDVYDEAGETDFPAPPSRQASASREIQEQAIAQLESLAGRNEAPAQAPQYVHTMTPADVADLVRSLHETCQRIESAVGHLGSEVQRLSHGASSVATVAIPRSMAEPQFGYDAVQAAPIEPLFQPAAKPVTVTFAAVPDFQGLMDMQRALSALLFADEASVLEYQDGEASFELRLRDAATAREIVDGLVQISGRKLGIEEAKPELFHLRLRFSEGNGHASIGLHPELWARA